ncbi:MAG: hypothetical protein ACOCS7_02070 [Halolamina sp.]
MPRPNYGALVSFLQEEYGDALRWVASFDSESMDYDIRYIRDDLKTDLSGFNFDTIVHRSIAIFNRRHVEDVYFHLGDAESLLVEYDEAIAVHLYLDDRRGVVIKIQSGADVSIPEFREACLERLES